MGTFVLHPRLAADTSTIADWPLCRLLLMEDARFPWLLLVPRRIDAVEWHDLAAVDRGMLADEIARAGAALKAATGASKINVGALGNLVSQLHVHVVARNRDDEAWPGAVWGQGVPVPYAPAVRAALLDRLSARLA